MKRFLSFLVAMFLVTKVLWAYDFKSGDLYYNITSSFFNTAEVTYKIQFSSDGYDGLTSVTIPTTVTYNGTIYSVTSIGEFAFYYCTGLTSITIPNSVTSIGAGAFEGCTGLTSVTIPESVTSISWSAFSNVPNIVYNGTATGSPWGARSVNGYIDGDLVYADAGKTTLLAGYTTATGAITIPESVTSIGSSAFYNCTSLTSIAIPNSVTSIGGDAFGNTAWYSNQPDGVVYINKVLYKYKGTMPQGTSIAIKEGTISISSFAFYNCTSLTSITIPNSVTSIGEKAFYNCTSLTSITIPNSVTSIGEKAFYYCTGLTSVTIPNSVTSIGSSAFRGCTGLTSITIPNSVTSIGESAFYNCQGLTTVTIGNSVTSIGSYAFKDCTGLNSIQVKAKTPPQCNDNTFFNVPIDIPVYVACDKEAYQNSTGWSSFTNIIEYREYSAVVQSSANGSAEMLSYTCDNELTIQATANEHYHFTQWSDGNTDNLRTFVVFQDTTLTAEFAPNPYNISTSATNGRVEGAGEYDYGTTATLVAIADEHYHFAQWSDGNTDNPRTIMIKGDATYTAKFAIDQFTITTTCDIRYGEVTGDGVYDYGTRITLTAIPNSGYEFKQWSNGLTYNPYRFTVLEDLSLEAVFVSSAATAIENTEIDTTPQKVLINGQVYILRNGKTYTLTGVEVE